MKLELDYNEAIFLEKDLSKKIDATDYVLKHKNPENPEHLTMLNEERTKIRDRLVEEIKKNYPKEPKEKKE